MPRTAPMTLDNPGGRRHWPEPPGRHQVLAVVLMLLGLGIMTIISLLLQ